MNYTLFREQLTNELHKMGHLKKGEQIDEALWGKLKSTLSGGGFRDLEKTVSDIDKDQNAGEKPSASDSGIWSSIKSGLAKAGSLDTMFGKGKKENQLAAQQLKTELERLDSESKKAIEGLKSGLEKSGFPNMKSQQQFTASAEQIATLLDSLKGASKAAKGEELIKINAASDHLAKMVQNYLDYELADVYKHFKENKDLNEVDEPTGPLTGERSKTIAGLQSNDFPKFLGMFGGIMTTGGALSNSKAFQDIAKSFWDEVTNTKVSSAASPDEVITKVSPKFDQVMLKPKMAKSLEGIKVKEDPGVILKKLKQTLDKEIPTDKPSTPDASTPADTTPDIPSKTGAADVVDKGSPSSTGIPSVKTDFGVTAGDQKDFLKSIAGKGNLKIGDISKDLTRLKMSSWNPQAVQGLKDFAKTLNKTVDQLTIDDLQKNFDQLPGTARGIANRLIKAKNIQQEAIGDVARKAKEAVKNLTKDDIKKILLTALKRFLIIKAGGVATAAGALAIGGAASSVLSGLGLGAAAAGLAVKALRMKGMKSSRAQVLNDLMKGLQALKQVTQSQISSPENAEEVAKEIVPDAASDVSSPREPEEPGKSSAEAPQGGTPPESSPAAASKKTKSADELEDEIKNILKLKSKKKQEKLSSLIQSLKNTEILQESTYNRWKQIVKHKV